MSVHNFVYSMFGLRKFCGRVNDIEQFIELFFLVHKLDTLFLAYYSEIITFFASSPLLCLDRDTNIVFAARSNISGRVKIFSIFHLLVRFGFAFGLCFDMFCEML